jgi:NAD(P)H dehydrogenase (quinone)
MKAAIVYHSGYGHTAEVAKAIVRGVAKAGGIGAQLIRVEDVDRHWDDLAAADAIVFGAPTYMGSLSAPFKAFMDATSKIWAQRGWKDKIAAGFTNSASHSGDKFNSLVQLHTFAMQHGMIWVGLDLLGGNNSSKGSVDDLNRLGAFIGAMAQSNADQGIEGMQPSDLRTAEHLGRRVALITLQFAGERVLAAA